MTRPAPLDAARRLVGDRFPAATQAWLGGSVILGGATATSDLDITVLDKSAVVHRESLRFEGWPVELFVHSEASISHFVAEDLAQRKPTMARLVAEGVELLPGDGGARIRTFCEDVLAAGPGPLSSDALGGARYALSDLVDDLRDAEPGPIGTAIAVETWRRTADLVLAANGCWTGGGKWLARELLSLDAAAGTHWATALHDSLQLAVAGDTAPLEQLADDALAEVGGRLWVGYRQAATLGENGEMPGGP
ncbi:nucleotidyltransferase domain-containing protein [Nocardioides sp. NPDC101246]|uniref:nucleotidyltransferase domain-containing protein n=1 Tax=Nocardioides sp. NPDC101246 TaxID=3364336 RepID=UPI0037FD2183